MTQDSAFFSRFLDLFPGWLRTLGDDARLLGSVVSGEDAEASKWYAAAGLTYIFKSLDLIADGVEDIGLCDDAFVIRVASRLACEEESAPNEGIVGRLSDDAKLVEEFLGADDYTRLVTYVKALRKSSARGRTVEDIMSDDAQRQAFLHEVTAWADTYQIPTFTRDVKTLIKLKAFLTAKLA